jgi:hypothetical protein
MGDLDSKRAALLEVISKTDRFLPVNLYNKVLGLLDSSGGMVKVLKYNSDANTDASALKNTSVPSATNLASKFETMANSYKNDLQEKEIQLQKTKMRTDAFQKERDNLILDLNKLKADRDTGKINEKAKGIEVIQTYNLPQKITISVARFGQLMRFKADAGLYYYYTISTSPPSLDLIWNVPTQSGIVDLDGPTSSMLAYPTQFEIKANPNDQVAWISEFISKYVKLKTNKTL